ncbi:hypothetical protein TWF730_002743 [Orbilia blumenaviensis]|uniref:Uncharacterized protein n=1 Tax=Orbilia blumenaviensis TaxID=1796055 RepID=A0AAV9U724_9PEZI
MPRRQTKRHILGVLICAICLSVGAHGQGYESDGSTGSGGSGNTVNHSVFRSSLSSRVNKDADLDVGRLTTVKETENELNTPVNMQRYISGKKSFASPRDRSFQQQKTIHGENEPANSYCDWLSFRGSGRTAETCRTRDNSPSDTQYDIFPLTSRRESHNGDGQQPIRQYKFGKEIEIPNLLLNSPSSAYGSLRTSTTFKGYGNLDPENTARGTSRTQKQSLNVHVGDEDDEPPLPTEPDEEGLVHSYDYGTPNLDLSTPEGESFSLFQGSRLVGKANPRKAPHKNSEGLAIPKMNQYSNSVTWFKPPSDESSELTKLQPVWQGEFLQPANAKGFLLTVLNALTDDLWVIAKGGFPYKGYNLFTQKFAEADAAKWNEVDGRLNLAGTDLIVYICQGGREPSVLSLVSIVEARLKEGKACSEELGGGVFRSLGWGTRKSKSAFVDPRIGGTLYWEGLTDTGNLQSIFPPQTDNSLWWSTRRADGERRRVPLVGFLGLPDNWNPILEHGPSTTETQKLSRKLPYLARYKPIDTDNDGFTNKFEAALWFKRPFQISGTFVNSAKTSTLVPWHIYVEEGKRRLFDPSKSNIDRFIIARPDGRVNTPTKPAAWQAKQVRPAGLGIIQNRVYHLPIDPAGYEYSKFIYTCDDHGVYLRVGTQKEATRECGQADWIYSSFEFFPSYLSYKGSENTYQEGTEMIFKPVDDLQGLRAISIDNPGVRPTAARLYVSGGYNYVFDGKIVLHAEIFA